MVRNAIYTLPESNEADSGMRSTSMPTDGGGAAALPHGGTRVCSDPWAQYYAALDYKARRDFLDVQKHQELQRQKLELRAACQQLMIDYRNYQKLMGCEVYRDSSGDLQYAITDAGKARVMTTRLLNVSGYSVRKLVCYYPRAIAVLEITWGSGDTANGFFWRIAEPKGSASFLRTLKANGVIFLVSGRTEKQAADALLAHSHIAAQEVEIPYAVGWGVTGSGDWHYAWDDELTMKEVLENGKN